MSKTLLQWLEQDCGCHDVRLVTVMIAGQVWFGAFYRQTRQYTHGMDAVRLGYKRAGDTYVEERIYCVGELPLCYRPEGVCFPYEGRDWYIVGYGSKECMREPYNEFHPFGLSFILGPWTDIQKIDYYSMTPYERIPLEVS